MAEQPEVIKLQMEETREALSEKIGALEDHVLGTVQDTTEAVSQTVEKVADAVQSTVDTVKEEVEKGVETVKHTFDLRHQVEQHPWGMLAGSVAVGYLAERLLAKPAAAPPWPRERPEPYARQEFAARESAEPGWFEKVGEQFEPALSKLKTTAIGAGMGLLGQLILDAAPPTYRESLQEIIDDVTKSLGAKPLPPSPSPQRPEYPRAHARNGFSEEETLGNVG